MDRNPPHPKRKPEPPMSAHRAFIYALVAPGWGEWYAGAKWRGVLTFTLLCLAFAWFAWVFYLFVSHLFANPLVLLQGGADQAAATDDSASTMIFYMQGTAWHLVVMVWMWAIIAGVSLARDKRIVLGLQPQTSAVWGMIMAWLCPGAGQSYMGKKLMAVVFFAAAAVAVYALLPVYLNLGRELKAILLAQPEATNSTFGVMNVVGDLMDKVKQFLLQMKVFVGYSMPELLRILVRCLAMADTALLLHAAGNAWRPEPVAAQPMTRAEAMVAEAARFEREREGLPLTRGPRVPWTRRPFPRALGHAGACWLCPGAGQFLQGRFMWGWGFLGAFLGCKLFLGLLFNLDLATAEQILYLTWIPGLIRWLAILEAFLWFLVVGRKQEAAFAAM